MGHTAFLTTRGNERQMGQGLLAIGDDLLHDLRQRVALEVHVLRGQAPCDEGNRTEVAEQVEVVVCAQEFRLRLVLGHGGGLDFGEVQQRIGAADSHVAPAVDRVGHHVGVGVGEVVELLPARLVVVGRVTPGVGVVRADVAVHDLADPLSVGHAPSQRVVHRDEGGADLGFGLVIVAGEELVDGLHFEAVLAAGGQHERDSCEDGEVALKLVHVGRIRR